MHVSRARAYDLFAAMPLMFWYAIAISSLTPELNAELRHLFVAFTWLEGAQILTQLCTLSFMGLMIAVFVTRRLPIAKAGGWPPRAVAIIASNLELAMLALPRSEPPAVLRFVSAILTSAGLMASVYVLSWLGRSFSILPQARGLVTGGPYKQIRHPLYLTETVAAVGVMLSYSQPWAGMLTSIGFVFQLVRMKYEERILVETFPEYRAYAAHTARLVPGIY